ncbi:MAG: hypothetical protein ABIW82_16820 [Dokdonella sp.]
MTPQTPLAPQCRHLITRTNVNARKPYMATHDSRSSGTQSRSLEVSEPHVFSEENDVWGILDECRTALTSEQSERIQAIVRGLCTKAYACDRADELALATQASSTIAYVVLPASELDIDLGDCGIDVHSFVIPWTEILQTRIEDLSRLCHARTRSGNLVMATATIDMTMVASIADSALEERAFDGRSADDMDFEPVVLTPAEATEVGLLVEEEALGHDTPLVEVTASDWRVCCEEKHTGLRIYSRRLPLDFDPMTLLIRDLGTTVLDRGADL